MKLRATVSAVVLLGLTPVAWAVPVAVQVLGPGDKPVAGAQVRARFWKGLADSEFGAPQSAVSDAQGMARFEAPDNGAPSMEGMKGQAVAWSPGLSLATAPLRLGQNPVVLAPRGTARGVVVDGAGKPVAGALVRLVRAMPGDISTDTMYSTYFPLDEKLLGAAFSVRSDARGAWSMSGLPLRGVVTVELGGGPFARDWATAAVEADDAPWSLDAALKKAAARAAAPPSAADASPYESTSIGVGALVARPEASITGRVLDTAGAPVAGASLSASFKVGYYAVASEPVQTDARGEFRIGRLGAGDFRLSGVLPPRDQARGMLPALPIKVTAAASTSTGDIRLEASGTVTVRVLDEATGKPVAGASAFALPKKDIGAVTLTYPVPQGEAGKSVLFLTPGSYGIVLAGVPEGYQQPESAVGLKAPTVEVQAGEDKVVEWKLQKALALSGRAVDAAGKPVPNAHLWFRSTKTDDYRSVEAAADGEGRWSTSSLSPGGWSVRVHEDDLHVEAPKAFSLPRQGALDIVLAPVGRVPISGKVVDDQGAPLAGARVDLKISLSFMPELRSAVTAQDGTWSVETVSEFASPSAITLSVSRAGYALQRGATATKQGNDWVASDAVLQKRDSRLAGRVLDSQGQPVAGAQVLAGSTQALAVSGQDGSWSLDDLPRGESEVVTVGGQGVLARTVYAPSESLDLRLKAPPAPPGRDVDTASEILEDAWETSRGSKSFALSSLAAPLAASDPDAALALAARGGPEGASEAILPIVLVMLRGDRDAAQAWAQANLAKAQKPLDREKVLLSLSEATVEADPAASARWLLQARATLDEVQEEKGGGERNAALARQAALAARLKQPDAEAVFAEAFKAASSGSYGSLIWQVAPVSEAWAAQIIEATIATAPPNPEYGMGPDYVAAEAIERLAPVDLAAAKRLLAKYGSIKSTSTLSMDSARSQVLGARARAGEDADVLIKEAEALGYGTARARALTLIAEALPVAQKARRVELMQRAIVVARQESASLMDTELQIIRRMIPIDRDAARSELEQARAKFEAPLDASFQEAVDSLRTLDIATWAWLYREFDPAGARLMIERQWAKVVAPSSQGQPYQWSSTDRLVLALAPLDIERAQQLALRLPVSGGRGLAFLAQRSIARWLLASPEERAAQPMDFWRSPPRADGRSSSDW